MDELDAAFTISRPENWIVFGMVSNPSESASRVLLLFLIITEVFGVFDVLDLVKALVRSLGVEFVEVVAVGPELFDAELHPTKLYNVMIFDLVAVLFEVPDHHPQPIIRLVRIDRLELIFKNVAVSLNF